MAAAGAGVAAFLPKEYGYVALVLAAYGILNTFMARKVAAARKKFNVPYPALYAVESENKHAHLFNCVQRGHQNSLEFMPLFFMMMILGGLRHPCIAAALGALFVVTRYFYFTGYSTGDPKNRLTIGKYGFVSYLWVAGLPYFLWHHSSSCLEGSCRKNCEKKSSREGLSLELDRI